MNEYIKSLFGYIDTTSAEKNNPAHSAEQE